MAKKSNTKSKEPEGEKVVCRNRKARFNYEILESIEAGIVLTGTEVKSLRAGKASLDDSYAKIEKDEVWLLKADIPEYAMGNWMNHVPKRKRKLLLHRREIAKLTGTSEQQKGQTLIPLSLYFKNGRAKVELGVAKGKKTHDKRQTIKDRDAKKAIKRATGIKRK